jgi:hypothetical protein
LKFLLYAVSLLTIFDLFGNNTINLKAQVLTKFKAYIPKINSSGNGCVGGYTPFIGDINNDQLDDAIVSFTLNPCSEGNIIIETQAAVYINNKNILKVVGAFPEVKCGAISKIEKGFVFVNYFECVPPYIRRTGEDKFLYENGSFKLVK